MEAINLALSNREIKPKTASGVVKITVPACRGFAANEPRWHQGCSVCSYDVVSEAIVYNHFRYYDPSTGRYITSDRIGLGDGPNTYAYVGGNPLMYVDINGLHKFDKWWGLPKQAQRWYHRNRKQKGDPDVPDKETADEIRREWENLGKPGPDKKRNQRNQGGFVTPEMLIGLLPVIGWMFGDGLACGSIDCDGDGFADDSGLPFPPLQLDDDLNFCPIE